jgi:cytochrome c peroxidase
MDPSARWVRPFSLGCGAIVTIWAVLVLGTGRVAADGQDVRIREVLAGANGASRAQFLVIEQAQSGQNLWGPQAGETQSRAMLVFYDGSGRETGIYKFPANPPTGGTLRTLVASAEFAAVLGAPAPDIVIPPLIQAISGKVCFTSNPLNEVSPFRDCLSYGTYSGETGSNLRSGVSIEAGAPAPSLPITSTVSLRRATDTGRNADFALTTTPTPANIAGATMTMAVDSLIVQGERLFTEETFGGNGRTCASCHVRSQSFGLQPAAVQTRFATLATTYDALFVAETSPSAFDAGFDYNLNVLTLTAAVATGAPCTGELRGTISSASTGARAKVIARTSSTSYLVGGGISPMLAGTVSDGTCAATVAGVTRGSLGAIANSAVPGLEDPRLMRTTRADPALFPFGRALFLENVDQLTLDNAALAVDPRVFRKSPHLLNMRFSAPFGFSGDIADLRTFSTGAVKQHYPRTLVRSSGGVAPDFRLPTADELAALEAFQLAQDFPSGTDPNKYDLDRFATSTAAIRGRAAFFGDVAKCSRCHGGPALSQMTATVLDQAAGTNGRFDTGVVNQVFSGGTSRDGLPCEPSTTSAGACGSRQFSVPQLFNVKNLTPLFHDASAADVETAIVFYNSPAFNDSPAGVAIGRIQMPAPANNCQPATSACTMIQDIAAFLESLVMHSLTASSATSATGVTGAAVSPVPSVIVKDDAGTSVSGATVTFTVTGGGGVVSGGSAVTNASGVATISSWVLGAGLNTLSANLEGGTGSPVTFSAFGAPAPATITLDRATLAFGATSTGTTLQSATPASSVRLQQHGTGVVTWTATSNRPWLTVTPASGTGSTVLSVGVQFDSTLPASGIATGAITLALTGSANAVSPVNVTLNINSSTAAASPSFGSFDSPAGDATVLAGSIALTGWALDNIAVRRVELWRDLQSGETTAPFASSPSDPRNGKVFIADASFVEGARPDVEGLYPSMPLNNRAGWGYLLLTWGLWDQGNGTYRLHAFAFDQEDNVSALGTKSVVVNNRAAAKPFGSIDTPETGGSAGGTVINFGWAITPRVNGAATCKIQPGGIQVSIDSGPLQSVVYGDPRTDIAAAFPGFSNTAAAGGHFVFDAGALPAGVHTIGWLVTDDCNRADGIGSRFFNVTSGTSALTTPEFRLKAESSPDARFRLKAETTTALVLTRGFNGSAEVLAAGSTHTIEVEQGERIELRMPRGYGAAFQQGPGGHARALPAGSTWDAASGTFYWQPAPGFLGRYRFVFSNGAERISVRVVVLP